MAGVSRQQYQSEIRLVRVMCSGRVDVQFIFRAFANGHDGVFIGGCKLDECNYVTHGNYDALGATLLSKRIMEHIGLDPRRLSIEFMSGGEGNVLVDVVDRFTDRVRELGPLGEREGLDRAQLARKLAAVQKVIPYLKLLERERLRAPVKSPDGYRAFWEREDVVGLLDAAIGEKLVLGQIMLLLEDGPLTTRDIAGRLGLSPSQVSKHMNSSSRQGFVRYDVEHNRYALA
jgi:coenzyme F420-reducing hydrogenase delta subunit